MKIEITKSTVCSGQKVSIGQVVDASEKDARLLISIGKAKVYQVMDAVKPTKRKAPRRKTAKGSL